MLAGIGGWTVAEAKERISKPEFEAWLQYRRLHGQLHPGIRLERAAALICATVHRAAGGTLERDDFLPQREVDEEAALATALETWR